jgi:hypothetical protein
MFLQNAETSMMSMAKSFSAYCLHENDPEFGNFGKYDEF